MSNKNRKSKRKIIVLLLKIVLFVYITLRTSYAIIYDDALNGNFLLLCFKRLYPFPFKLCFSPYAFIWLGVYIIIYAWYLSYKNKPRADIKWKEKEHGSNEFQTKSEQKEFLEKCTDKIIDMSNEEIEGVLLFLGEK